MPRNADLSHTKNHRFIEWFGLDRILKIISFQPNLPCAGTLSPRPDCPRLHPTWPCKYAGTSFCNLGFWEQWFQTLSCHKRRSIVWFFWNCPFAMLGRDSSNSTTASSISGMVAALGLQLWAFPWFWVVGCTFSNYHFDEITHFLYQISLLEWTRAAFVSLKLQTWAIRGFLLELCSFKNCLFFNNTQEEISVITGLCFLLLSSVDPYFYTAEWKSLWFAAGQTRELFSFDIIHRMGYLLMCEAL